jgi:hypothetical protein
LTFTQENRHDHRFEDVLRINLRGTFLGCQIMTCCSRAKSARLVLDI